MGHYWLGKTKPKQAFRLSRVSQSVGRSVGRLVGRSGGRSVGRSVSRSVGRSVSQSVSRKFHSTKKFFKFRGNFLRAF